MGGTALKNVKTKRINTNELCYIYNNIIQPVLYEFNIESYIPKFYNLKDDHGDIDIVLNMENDYEKVLNIINLFKPKEIYAPKGCNTYSFDLCNTQIDFIIHGIENYNTSCHFFSHGDLHNLLGKIYHQFHGLKMGYDGLKYSYYNNNQRVGYIYLTKDYKKIYEFLGLDYDVISNGFDTIQDMFNYVISCKYFTTKLYMDHNLRAIDKKRNKKRKGFILFKEFIKSLNDDYNKPLTNISLEDIISFFGVENWKSQENYIIQKIERNNKIKSKFSGKKVEELTNLSGKNLGDFIKTFKKCIEDSNILFEEWILNNSIEYINDQILKQFNNY